MLNYHLTISQISQGLLIKKLEELMLHFLDLQHLLELYHHLEIDIPLDILLEVLLPMTLDLTVLFQLMIYAIPSMAKEI